ncbi:MAG: hypothetical protein ACKVTZ_06945 [Bacteroidia bacterium]
MNRTFHYVGTALLFLVASACQETSDDAEQISKTKTPVASPTAATDTTNLLQANSTATALSLGKLAIPTAQTSTIPLTNIAAQESRNAVADAADSDTILSQTTQDLWKIAPEMETFVLKAEEENTLELKQGSVIEFPKDAFVYAGTNEPVKGNVAIMAKEYRNMSDCITAGLTTMSDKGILESGGMMYVDAVAEGRKCELRKDKPMKVALPAWGKKDERMTLFTGKRKKNGQVTWKEMPKAQGEQLPESEAPKRKKKLNALAYQNNFNYLVGPKFVGYESMPDTSFEAFVSQRMLAVNRVRNCRGERAANAYKLNYQGKNNVNYDWESESSWKVHENGSYYFPVRNTDISFSQAPLVKISQENILTNVDKTTAPKDYVALTGKTLKVLKLELEDKWEEKKDGNNQTYYVNKIKPLRSQLKMQEEKTFCRIYVKTNQKGAATEIVFRDYNFILTRYMHKWLEYALRQRVWKPNVEGNVFVDVYVGKKDFRKMKRWYANKATNLEECKAQYEVQYQKYLQECRDAYAKNPEIRAAREKEMAEYEVRKAEYEKREKMTAAEREKAFAQDFKANPNDFDEMTVQNYVFRTNRMGWINCDRFPGLPLMTLKFNLKKGEFVNAVVAFNSIRSMLGGTISNPKTCTFQTPKNEKLLVWLVKEQDGKRYFALKRLVSGRDNGITEADFQELTFEKLQEITKAFSKISET